MIHRKLSRIVTENTFLMKEEVIKLDMYYIHHNDPKNKSCRFQALCQKRLGLRSTIAWIKHCQSVFKAQLAHKFPHNEEFK